MIYVYCICAPAAVTGARARGLGGARLRVLEAGPLAAVFSRHRSFCVRPTVDQVLTHERVIESFIARGPVLPLRFGTRFEREEQLSDALGRRARELSDALGRVRGHVELGLRVIPRGADAGTTAGAMPTADTGTPAAATPTGRDVLLARVDRHNRTRRLLSDLHTPLANLAAASTVRDFPRPPALLVSSYLVDDEQAEAFRRRAADLAAQHDDVHILVTGPWPPYSFVGETG